MPVPQPLLKPTGLESFAVEPRKLPFEQAPEVTLCTGKSKQDGDHLVWNVFRDFTSLPRQSSSLPCGLLPQI